MSEQTRDTEETIDIFERKLGMLRRDYEFYFLGTRPREPLVLRSEVFKLVAYLSNTPIPNTALRFKFSSLCSRYQAHKRQWDEILRKIEAGTYERHQFKARIHAQARSASPVVKPSSRAEPKSDLYLEYLDARLACGQSTKGVSRQKLEQQLERQKQQLRQKFGDDVNFQFRVAVEDGKVRLKAKRAG
jgi:hypothetical protein